MADGEVRDVRSRNRPLKICVAVLILLILLAGIGFLVYFFVFAEDDMSNVPHLELIPKSESQNLIAFKHADAATGTVLVNQIEEFLQKYRNQSATTNVTTSKCGDDYLKAIPNDTVPCAIDVVNLNTECSMANSAYGYIDGRAAPCVIVKLNQIVGFLPEPYDNLTEAEEQGMPKGLVEFIKELDSGPEVTKRKKNTTWITCEGENPVDKEGIVELSYFFPGFNAENKHFFGVPNMFFPYLEQPGYVDPFLFVKFMKPVQEVVIRVKCRAWAKNIDIEKGSLTFELRVD